MTNREAAALKRAFDDEFHVCRAWRDSVLQLSEKTNSARTLLGRRRLFNDEERTATKACNSVVQGSVADFVSHSCLLFPNLVPNY